MESQPILCAHLLRVVDAKLVELLRALTPEDWDKQTIAPRWKVRDVAAHLLDTQLRKLSMVRDHNVVEQVEIRSEQDLVDLINRLNDEGVKVYRRLSPPLLIRFMEIACEQSADFHESLDPFASAAFAVSWAGETESLNWFDTARELTERWHHQQQIRLATNRPGIMTPELYHPVLDCFLRGLPHRFRSVDAEEETKLVVEIAGDCGGSWVLSKATSGWQIAEAETTDWSSRITIPQAIAWRVFTKGIDREAARHESVLEGEKSLGEAVLGLTAIVG
jgi:uncharacterized protein (TIGR03083 family)